MVGAESKMQMSLFLIAVLLYPPLTSFAAASLVDAHRFHYNGELGVCLDALGKKGLNKIQKSEFLKDKNGECGDFQFLGILNPSDFPFVQEAKLNDWNLKGADLSTFFVSGGDYCGIDFVNADLRGAKMDGIAGTYWCIQGVIDRHTTYVLKGTPTETFGCELLSAAEIKCVR